MGTGTKKIRVNSINPGMVEAEGVHAAGFVRSDFQKQIEAQTPLGRIAQPDEIGPIAVFQASTDSGWLSGETLHKHTPPHNATEGGTSAEAFDLKEVGTEVRDDDPQRRARSGECRP